MLGIRSFGVSRERQVRMCLCVCVCVCVLQLGKRVPGDQGMGAQDDMTEGEQGGMT